MNKKRILWISDSPDHPTGNAKITRKFIQNVPRSGEYEIAVLGRAYIGWPGEQERYDCTIFPMNIGRPYPEIMREISRQFRPQVIISCLDMWQIDWVEHAKLSEAVTNIGYISIYGKPVPYSWKKVVKSLDYAICYSEFGKSVLKEFMPFASIDMIHLGVDPDLFRPLEKREQIKEKRGLKDKFVIGCIARNQLRKRLDKLFEGFAIFSRSHPDAHLYVKTELVTSHGYNLPELAEFYGISDKTTLEERKEFEDYTEEELSELYNMFDVYVQTAGAEGFGIPLLEAMSCGLPVIAPDYSACSELVHDRGILLSPCFHRVVDAASVEQVSIKADELARALETLYSDDENREKMGMRGRVFAESMNWNVFTDRWLDVLSNVKWEKK